MTTFQSLAHVVGVIAAAAAVVVVEAAVVTDDLNNIHTVVIGALFICLQFILHFATVSGVIVVVLVNSSSPQPP